MNQIALNNRILCIMTLSHKYLYVWFFICLVFLIAGAEEAEEESSPLILKNADFNRNTTVNGEWVSYLKGNVEFFYDNATIIADEATWYRADNKIIFQHNIKANMKEQELSCERIDFIRSEKKLIAQHNVDFFDQKEQIRVKAHDATYLFDRKHLTLTKNPQIFFYDTAQSDTVTISAEIMVYDDSLKRATAVRNVDFFDQKEQVRIVSQRAVFETEKKNLVLTQEPKLFRYDTSQVETLTITSEIMYYNDSLKTATAERNVKIEKGDLSATCKRAAYDNNTGIAKLRNDPWIFYEIHEITGDSVDLFFSNEYLDGVAIMRNSRWFHRDTSGGVDTVFTKVTGDSIYIAMHDSSNTFKTIWTYDDAEAFYYSSNKPESINEANGKVMQLDFARGKPHLLTISGNAEFLYHLEDKKENGRNEASGDNIAIRFKNGEAVYMSLNGAVRGTYYSDRAQ